MCMHLILFGKSLSYLMYQDPIGYTCIILDTPAASIFILLMNLYPIKMRMYPIGEPVPYWLHQYSIE